MNLTVAQTEMFSFLIPMKMRAVKEIICPGSYDESGPGNRMSYDATVANLQSR